MITSAAVISRVGSYYVASSCDEILYLYGGAKDPVLAKYSSCAIDNMVLSAKPNTTSVETATNANYYSLRPEEVGSSLKLGFSMAIWMSIFLHVVATEIYLHLTPAETTRLKEESKRRQAGAGLLPTGNAGLTAERLGDV